MTNIDPQMTTLYETHFPAYQRLRDTFTQSMNGRRTVGGMICFLFWLFAIALFMR